MSQQVKCPQCGRMVAKKRSGLFYPHAATAGSFTNYAGARCPMSNRAPSSASTNPNQE